MSKTIKNRIINGSLANIFTQLVTLSIQLGSLPIFLYYWDLSKYGYWITLTAIPSYLALSEVGVTNSAGNEMIIAVNKGDFYRANEIFQSALLFMVLIIGILTSLGIIIPTVIISTGQHISLESYVVILVLAVGVLLGMLGGYVDIVFKSTQKYSMGIFLAQLIRLGEWFGYILGLMFVGTFIAVAICGVFARLIGLIIYTFIAMKHSPEIHFGFKDARLDRIRKLIKPALLFSTFPFANAINFQGTTLIVAYLFGPVSVLIFTTYRTIARTIVQINGVFSNAIWPEFTMLYSNRNNHKILINLYQKSFNICILISLISILIFYIIGPFILDYWSSKKIEYDKMLMIIILLYAFIGSIGHIPRVFILSINEHKKLAYITLITALISLPINFWMGIIYKLNGVGLAMLTLEIILISFSIKISNSIINNIK